MKKIKFIISLLVSIFMLNIAKAQVPIAANDYMYSGYAYSCQFYLEVLNNDKNLNQINDSVFIIKAPFLGTASVTPIMTINYLSGGPTTVGKTDTLVYVLKNSAGRDTATVYIKIRNTNCNNYPIGADDYATGCMGDSIIINLTKNDIDIEGDTVLYRLSTNISNYGTVTKLNDSQVIYISNIYTQDSLNDHFYYKAYDFYTGVPSLGSSGPKVNIKLYKCSNAPFITTDSFPKDTVRAYIIRDTMYEDQVKNRVFHIYDKDKNDIGKITHIDSTNHITVTHTDNGITIKPDPNWSGIDTFYITTCDKRNYCTSTQYILVVLPVADPPVAISDTMINTTNNPSIKISVIKNDTDKDIPYGDQIHVFSYDTNSAKGGTITKSGDTLMYHPTTGSVGLDSFKYTIIDLTGGKSQATVYIYNPAVLTDDKITILQSAPTVIKVLENDLYVPGSTLIIDPARPPMHGTAVVNADKTISYTPNNGYVGPDTFYYVVIDTLKSGEIISRYARVIIVSDEFKLPLGISPDGDNNNDALIIKGIEQFPDSKLQVFNRWGDLVWENSGIGYINGDFKGDNFKDKPLPDGTYYIVLNPNKSGYDKICSCLTIHR